MSFQAFIVYFETADHDADLLDKVPAILEDRFPNAPGAALKMTYADKIGNVTRDDPRWEEYVQDCRELGMDEATLAAFDRNEVGRQEDFLQFLAQRHLFCKRCRLPESSHYGRAASHMFERP